MSLNAEIRTFSDYKKKFAFSMDLCKALVKRYRINPVIRTAALGIMRDAGVPARAKLHEIAALHAFVRDKITFRGDINGIETIQTPDYTLRMSAGDCDDKAVLLNSLLETVGFRTRFVTISQNADGAMSHIFGQVFTGDIPEAGRDWLSLETVRPVALGVEPQNYTKRAVYDY